MAAVLEKPIKRELQIDGAIYTLTISPEGVKIVPKGRRIGREMTWRDLLSGDAELASQLLRSVSESHTTGSAVGKTPRRAVRRAGRGGLK